MARKCLVAAAAPDSAAVQATFLGAAKAVSRTQPSQKKKSHASPTEELERHPPSWLDILEEYNERDRLLAEKFRVAGSWVDVRNAIRKCQGACTHPAILMLEPEQRASIYQFIAERLCGVKLPQELLMLHRWFAASDFDQAWVLLSREQKHRLIHLAQEGGLV